ncbi:MAG: hypothetical protein PHR25_03345 [Clostridia bacterium]|nr:hypothetical protein [Clostridia bacterium]MDD4375796.1 hypothetical protein [Clostridia bacterium]
MERCIYCNSIMFGENETKRDKSYNFFNTCPTCKSIYEGTKDKNDKVLKSRWWNSQKQQFESANNY